jgi:hypothetical protein
MDSFDEGTAWRERHQPLIDQILVPVAVHRWPDWTGPADFETGVRSIRAHSGGETARTELAALIVRRRPGFENQLRRIKALAQADRIFRDAVPASAAWCPVGWCRRSAMSGSGSSGIEAVDGRGSANTLSLRTADT